MKQAGIPPRVMAGAILGLACVVPLAAQSRLYILEPDGNYHRVLKASKGLPYIMAQDHMVPASGRRFALNKVDEYVPAFIAVNRKEVSTTAIKPNTPGAMGLMQLNNEFHFQAEFESPAPLDDVFLALELEFADGGKNIFLYEVGRLEPRIPQALSLDLPLDRNAAPGQCKLHLFARGEEVFTSELPADFRAAALDRMIIKRIAAVQQAEPKPFFGPDPEYPPTLRKSRVKGRAMVTVRITPQGKVLDPVIASASDPAFGEAAIAALWQWRFLPRVKDGRAVEARITLPFEFDLPAMPGPEKN
jgi:TonB family protein